jgi:transcriptional regulator with XRE-family HTH domain
MRRRPANLRLTELRFEAGLSQRGLASIAGVTPGVVQLAEKGWTPHPGHAGAILEVLERKLDRKVRYIEIWPPAGTARL